MSQAGGERPSQDSPRIYVASLSDYNAGRLHGVWLNADQDADRLAEDIQVMLDHSPEPNAEEYAIHDYEGFGHLRLDEFESLERVAGLARGIAEHGPAFAAWVSVDDEMNPTLERFEQAYRGTWKSIEHYGDELLADLGADEYLAAVPAWLQPYVRLDSQAFSRDLVLGGDIAAIQAQDGVYIFDRTT